MITSTLLSVLIGISIVYLLALGLLLYRRDSRIKRIAYTLDSVLALFDQIRAYDSKLLERFNLSDMERVGRELAAQIAQDAEARYIIMSLLNLLEVIGIATSTGVYDLRTIDRLYGMRILQIWDRYELYVQERRKEYGRSLYEEFERFARRIRSVRPDADYRP